MKQKLQQFLARRSVRHGGGAVALVALVLALFYLVNLVILGAANHFSWYFYTTEQYDLSVSGAADDLLGDIPTAAGKVEIIFCDLEENISGHGQLDYVYQTARGLAERHPDLIELSFVNLWLEPARVAEYRVAEDGSENTLSSTTVIVDYNGTFMLNSASTFYTLDDENYVTAYNGEEVFVANILWVTAAEHPVAYFTANHGEEIPTALQRRLVAAGYRVDRVDLAAVSEIPADAGMVIISAPVYDFQRSAEGTTYVSELTKLENYLAAGGKMYVSLHPDHTDKLPRLTGFLASYGVAVESGVLVDRETALPGSNGYSLIASYAESGLGAALDENAAIGGRRPVLSYAAPLTITESALAEAEAVLYSASSAAVLLDGQEYGSGGAPLMAIAHMRAGEGTLLVSGSPYLADTNMMNGAGYANRELVNALLIELGAERVATGIPFVMVDRSAIENLTLGEADIYTACAALLIPAAILAGGLIYCRRRKNH